MKEDVDPSIFDDPKRQLGGNEVDLELTKHKDSWHLNFAGDYYSIRIKNHQAQYAPLAITCCEPDEGRVNWLLSKDPLWWHFEPNCKITASTPGADTWGRLDFIRALSSWPVENVADPMLTSILQESPPLLGVWMNWMHLQVQSTSCLLFSYVLFNSL